MNVFKLHPKAGEHVETSDDGSTKSYFAGDTITTEKDLDKMFPGKFLRLSASTSTEFGDTQPEIPIPLEFTSFNAPKIPIPPEFAIDKQEDIVEAANFAIDKQTLSSINDMVVAELDQQGKAIEKEEKTKAKKNDKKRKIRI